MKCLKCNTEITEVAATGRPKRYCSITCRRAAGFEITRTTRLLERIEFKRLDLELLGPTLGFERDHVEQLARHDNAKATLEDRLLTLVSDD